MNKYRSREYEVNTEGSNMYQQNNVLGNQSQFYQQAPFRSSEFYNFGSFSFDRDSFENPQFTSIRNSPVNVSLSSSVFDNDTYKNISLSTQHNSADYILPVRRLSDPNEKPTNNFNNSYANYHPKIRKPKSKRLIFFLTSIPIAIIILVTIILVVILQNKCK